LTQAQLRKLKAVGSPISNPNFQAAQEESVLPFGGVPVYTDGDVRLSQCGAILQVRINQSANRSIEAPSAAPSAAEGMLLTL